jgi:hypothetical protein
MREAIAPLQNQLTQFQVQSDFQMASIRHAEDFVPAWQKWTEQVGTGQDPVSYFRVMNAPSPGEALVEWYKEQRVREEVGLDPAAFRERVRQEILAEMGLAPGGQGGAPVQGVAQPPGDPAPRLPNGQFAPKQQVRLPTPTGRMGSSQKLAGTDANLDGSDEAIFEAARPRSRRDR